MFTQIDHVNIVVNDLNSMTAFYRDALGFEVTKEVTISGEWVESVVGLEGVVAEVVYLAPPSGPRVELIRYVSPEGHCPPDLGRSNTRCLRHIAFQVEEIDAAVARLKSVAVRLLSEVQRVPNSQVTYSGGVCKQLVYFHDPEGNLLELCEYKAKP